MRRTWVLVLALAIVGAAGAFAQAFTVSYLDGTVELQTAKGWSAVSIGDQVAADATVRISQQGSLELSRAKTKITLLKDGVFSIASLAKASSSAGAGVGGSISQKLQTLVTEKPKASTAGGVRGAEQGSANVTWVDEGDETRSQAQSLIDAKKYQDAAAMLSDAIKNAGPDTDTSELGYLLGVAYYGAGQTAKAYRALGQVNADPGTTWYARYVILRAQVLVDTQNYNDALTLLGPFTTTYPTGEATQVAWLLSGISQRALGNAAAAKTDFDTGYQLDPSTDTARLIDQQRHL
ncbi:MAG TPA: tetratricopeptide repeat protein [Spirochaetia bacterium]|nr:tetratricopeptide repeat protein [Spirochaetia bacterium]